jgi:SAM-dependent methyltransferase
MNTAYRYQSGEYLAQNPTWHVEDAEWKADQIRRMVVRHKLRTDVVCEVGCGAGGVLHHLHKRMPGSKCVGYDISPQALELAEHYATTNLEFRLGDIQAETIERSDLLLVVDVIEHLEDYFSFLRAARSISERAIFHIPLDASAQAVLRKGKLLGTRKALGHLHYFTKDVGLAALEDTGYRVLDWCYTAGAVAWRPQSRKAKAARFPRRALFALNADATVRAFGGYSMLVLAASGPPESRQ